MPQRIKSQKTLNLFAFVVPVHKCSVQYMMMPARSAYSENDAVWLKYSGGNNLWLHTVFSLQRIPFPNSFFLRQLFWPMHITGIAFDLEEKPDMRHPQVITPAARAWLHYH
jgi:hypothetical protein